VRWLLLPFAPAVDTSEICVVTFARRIFAFRFVWYPKWVLCLGIPLELVFGIQNTMHDLLLRLGCVIGDSLIRIKWV
jgi:hypothetical protein